MLSSLNHLSNLNVDAFTNETNDILEDIVHLYKDFLNYADLYDFSNVASQFLLQSLNNYIEIAF